VHGLAGWHDVMHDLGRLGASRGRAHWVSLQE
jgi:hypothetical protein